MLYCVKGRVLSGSTDARSWVECHHCQHRCGTCPLTHARYVCAAAAALQQCTGGEHTVILIILKSVRSLIHTVGMTCEP